MNSPLRIIFAVSVCLLSAGAPALAQENQVTAVPPQNEIVGPPQLQNFSLNGTVTRPSEEPAPVQRQPATQQQQRRAEAPPQQTESAAASRADRTSSSRAATPQPAQQRESTPSPAAPVTGDLFATPGTATTSTGAADSLPQQDPVLPPAPAESPGGIPMLPWIIAALALVGAAGWFFLRQRPRTGYATAGHSSMFELAAESEQELTPPPPPPVESKPESTGIVSSRLRPWLEIEFTPQRGVVDDEKAAVAFEISVLNSGSVPARDVLLEASLFNAGPMQDQQIRLFFQNPVAKGDKIPLIPPFKRITVNTAVFLARDQVKPIEIEGRTMFVPMIAFNALYGWSGGKGQTSASYLVGKKTSGEKLAPFRLDLGPRVFRNLEARTHELQLRK